MRIWSILWIKSVLKWCIHLSRSLFFIFQLLGECHCWWTKESPRAHVAKFYGRFRLIRSIWEHHNFPCSKLIEIVILWVYYTIPFGFSLFRYFWDIVFPLLNYFVWQKITDESSVPEMRIWSILWIKSVLIWCIHLSRSLFFIFKFLLRNGCIKFKTMKGLDGCYMFEVRNLNIFQYFFWILKDPHLIDPTFWVGCFAVLLIMKTLLYMCK